MEPNEATADLERAVEAPSEAVLPVEGAPGKVADAEWEKAGAQARAFMTKDSFREVIGSMLAFRQGYVMAYNALQRLLDRETDVHPLVADVLVQSAAHGAAQAFDEQILLKGYQETVFPWMLRTVAQHNAEDREELKKQFEAEEEARRQRDVPIGVALDPGGSLSLPRSQSLVLTGWRPAVLWVLDQIVTHTLAARDQQTYTVVRFQAGTTQQKPDAYLLRLGGKAWAGCCNSNSSLPKLAAAAIYPLLQLPPDLLVVDDLPAAITNGLVGRASASVAGDAHRRLRKMANEVGCGLVGAILQPTEDPPDLSPPPWENLRTFTTLRPVKVIREAANLAPGQVRILVGRNAHYWDVDQAVLDSYGGSGLILKG